MIFAMLDMVALVHDLPERGLRSGDLGTIVTIYEPDGVEVEFVRPWGRTVALVTLRTTDVRALSPSDMLAVRSA